MLFDLRSRGRRRVIKVVYLLLAVLLGGGLVLFGIGGEVSGGLVEGVFGNNRPERGTEEYRKDRDAAVRTVRADPGNDAAWREVISTNFNLARTTEGSDSEKGTYDAEGRRYLADAAKAFEDYTATKPDDKNIYGETATLALRAYEALDDQEGVVRAAEISAQVRNTPESYLQLASYAYQSDQSRKGDLAGEKAIDLADNKEDRQRFRDTLDQIKGQVAQAQAEQGGATATGAPSGGAAAPPAGGAPSPAPTG